MRPWIEDIFALLAYACAFCGLALLMVGWSA